MCVGRERGPVLSGLCGAVVGRGGAQCAEVRVMWQGFRWIGTDADLAAANRAHADRMAVLQARAVELARAALLVKGRG